MLLKVQKNELVNTLLVTTPYLQIIDFFFFKSQDPRIGLEETLNPIPLPGTPSMDQDVQVLSLGVSSSAWS